MTNNFMNFINFMCFHRRFQDECRSSADAESVMKMVF